MKLDEILEKAGLEKPQERAQRKRRSRDWYPDSSKSSSAIKADGLEVVEQNLTAKLSKEAPVAAEVASQVQASVAAEVAPQVQAPVAAEVASQVQAPVAAEVASQVQAPVAAEVASQVQAPVAAEVASQVQAPVAAEVASLDVNNILKSKVNSKFLSDTVNYLLIENSWVSILSEICKLCIENNSLISEKISYDFLSKKSGVNSESIRRIIRRLESESVLVFKENYFQKGHKGRNFEITKQAMLCMLTNDMSLRKWIARRSTSVTAVQKIYDFM